MASENAKAVAKEVSENLRKGKRIILGKIIRKHGYTKSTSTRPKIVTETKSYQQEIKPVIQQLELERQRLISALRLKDLDEVQYSEMVRSLDLLTKNIQLLSDKPTENLKSLLTDEQIDELLLNRKRERDNTSRQK